ncbi:T-complex protein 1 subunit eta [Diplonema papillatum]|nr:T-complex protein 1 subunit eta [Diplonema papillatum]
MQVQPQIILLREGTDTSQGIGQLISNINACLTVVDTVKTTLGPRGLDKLIQNGNTTTISNDGATVMQCLRIAHPAAKTLVEIAQAQDAEVGDGTTSVVVLAGEFLREAKQFVEDGVHMQVIIRAYRDACEFAINHLSQIAVPLADAEGEYEGLVKCAQTALNSKLIKHEKGFFAKMAVDAVEAIGAATPQEINLDLIGIKKVLGGSMVDSLLVKGVAFKKTFSYAGFEQQPKSFTNPKILMLNLELELKAEKDNAEIRIKDPSQYQAIVDAEWRIIYEKLEQCVESGAKIILSKLPIGDLATQYFADRGLFCAGRVPIDDLRRVASSCGGIIQTTVRNLGDNVLGSCESFEEKQLGNERYNFFYGGSSKHSVTIILRGGAEHFVDEADRSLHDALCIVKRAKSNATVVAGGGAIEMELSKQLRGYARSIRGKPQIIVNSFARALEVIPRLVADNAGFDSTDILNKLRQKHYQAETPESIWYGVDINNDDVCDTFAANVLEPASVKKNALRAATEAACLILSIDETVTNPESEQAQAQGGKPRMGGGAGGSMAQMGMKGMGGMKGLKTLKGMGGK